MVTRVSVSAGTWVPGSGSGYPPPDPVGYPVPNFEAGVQLYCALLKFSLVAKISTVVFFLHRRTTLLDSYILCPTPHREA